ncbi:APC family permease [Rhizobium lentis]|uniref:APC family permease n=1 Tax=Rhizobium lentis TaxID=1138194 RepID=UPI001C840828|nr:APC family permease [Rhizobium lentis]MBX5041288.1 APC family permease [Rhizobium lentis]MBX5071544.1 APC family permease [Rhizobium lentis]MBX5108418.1 APC family permease [Rhizobium lentis]MBX5117346.1 APC family permease [Rhizobium lentis]
MSQLQQPGDRGLRTGSLGVAAITLMVVSAVAPLTNMAGVLPVAILFGNGTAIVPAFILMMVLVLIFSVGYVTMARHVQNAGAFYTLITQGLGKSLGGAAALIALLGYNCMQIGMSGMFGPVCTDLIKTFTGLDVPWWAFSLGASALIGVLAYRRVDLSAKVLGVLVLAEFAVILILDLGIAIQGVPGGFDLAPLSLAGMPSTSALGVTFVFAFGCYIGIEATTLYSDEAKEPKKTIPRATYAAVLLIGLFYSISTIWIVEAAGTSTIVTQLQGLGDPIQFVFNIADQYVGNWLAVTMRVLFVTSVFACLLAFHNHVARYFYYLGKEGMVPSWLGRTHDLHQSPHRGTIVQTVIALAVIAAFAIAGLNPLLTLFAWVANIAVICIIVLMTLVSIAVIAYFTKNPELEPNQPLKTKVMPALATIGFALVAYFGISGFDILTGAPGPLAIALPSLILIAGIIGAIRATMRPDAIRRLNADPV